MAGNSELDRRMLLAVAHSSAAVMGKPLRIIDARPYINAQVCLYNSCTIYICIIFNVG